MRNSTGAELLARSMDRLVSGLDDESRGSDACEKHYKNLGRKTKAIRTRVPSWLHE
jgi:hypothetical protein